MNNTRTPIRVALFRRSIAQVHQDRSTRGMGRSCENLPRMRFAIRIPRPRKVRINNSCFPLCLVSVTRKSCRDPVIITRRYATTYEGEQEVRGEEVRALSWRCRVFLVASTLVTCSRHQVLERRICNTSPHEAMYLTSSPPQKKPGNPLALH
jgi:hypothetical protein